MIFEVAQNYRKQAQAIGAIDEAVKKYESSLKNVNITPENRTKLINALNLPVVHFNLSVHGTETWKVENE